MSAEADVILAVVTSVVPALQATFGRKREVVLHDYRRPERSTVAITGESPAVRSARR